MTEPRPTPAEDSPDPSPERSRWRARLAEWAPRPGRPRANAAATLGLQLAGAGLSFLAMLVLARLLGVAEFGRYSLAFSWAGLLAIPAGLGTERLLVREVAVYEAHGDRARLRGLLRWTNRATLAASILLGSGLALGVILLGGRLSASLVSTFLAAALLLPWLVLTRVRQSVMRGLRHTAVAHVPELLVLPFVFLAAVGAGGAFLPGGLGAPQAMLLRVLSVVAAFGAGAMLLRRRLPERFDACTPAYDTRRWKASVPPLLFLSGLQVLHAQADVVLLGAFRGSSPAGVYTAAAKLATLGVFVLTAINKTLAPAYASLFATGRREVLQRVVTQAAKVSTAASLVVFAVLVALGAWILGFFGEGFETGYVPVLLLGGAQVVNGGFASVGLLLAMTRFERVSAAWVGASVVLNVLLDLVLIPPFGMRGAAAATATSITLLNVGQGLAVRRLLGVNPTVLSVLRPRSGTGTSDEGG